MNPVLNNNPTSESRDLKLRSWLFIMVSVLRLVHRTLHKREWFPLCIDRRYRHRKFLFGLYHCHTWCEHCTCRCQNFPCDGSDKLTHKIDKRYTNLRRLADSMELSLVSPISYHKQITSLSTLYDCLDLLMFKSWIWCKNNGMSHATFLKAFLVIGGGNKSRSIRSCRSCCCSNSLIRTPRQRWLTCHKMEKTNFTQLFSVQKPGMVIVRRFCSTKARSSKLVVRMRLWCTEGQRR